jgi:hypothetical protein
MLTSTEWFFIVDCIKAAGIWAIVALLLAVLHWLAKYGAR